MNATELNFLKHCLTQMEQLRNLGGGASAIKLLLQLKQNLRKDVHFGSNAAELELYVQNCYLAAVCMQDGISIAEFGTTIQLFREGIWAAKELGSPFLFATGLLHLSNAYRILGDLKSAIKLLIRAEGISSHPWLTARAGIIGARIAGVAKHKSLFETSSLKISESIEFPGVIDGQVNFLAKAEVEARANAEFGEIDKAVNTLIVVVNSILEPKTWQAIAKTTLGELLVLIDTGLAKKYLCESLLLSHEIGLSRQLLRAHSCAERLGGSRILLELGFTDRMLGKDLVENISNIPKGFEGWKDFELAASDLLTYCLVPPLEYGGKQINSADGIDRVDLAFWNDTTIGFWRLMREEYQCRIVVCEIKNTPEIHNKDLNQLCSYLDSVKGHFGILVKRGASVNRREILASTRKLRKGDLIIILNDRDLISMVYTKMSLGDSSVFLKSKYYSLIQSY